MSLKSNPSSLNDLSLNNFMTLAHSLSIEGLDKNFSSTENNEAEEHPTKNKMEDELRGAIEVLKKSLLDFEMELVFSNEMELDDLNLKIQKYYHNKILYETLVKQFREKRS